MVKDKNGMYMCRQCDYRARHPSQLRDHVGVKHDGVVYSCDHCGFGSAYKHRLLEHCRRYGHGSSGGRPEGSGDVLVDRDRGKKSSRLKKQAEKKRRGEINESAVDRSDAFRRRRETAEVAGGEDDGGGAGGVTGNMDSTVMKEEEEVMDWEEEDHTVDQTLWTKLSVEKEEDIVWLE